MHLKLEVRFYRGNLENNPGGGGGVGGKRGVAFWCFFICLIWWVQVVGTNSLVGIGG